MNSWPSRIARCLYLPREILTPRRDQVNGARVDLGVLGLDRLASLGGVIKWRSV
jgi:hypothetical protein